MDLPKELARIEIVEIADLHTGDALSSRDDINCRVDYVKNTPDCYALLCGDIANMAIEGSKSDGYSANMSPTEQIISGVELFAPIKEKILGITTGNHEDRIYRRTGVDISRLIARELGIENRYSQESLVIFLRFGENDGKNHKRPVLYTIYAVHGSGGGTTKGGKANALQKRADIIDADLVFSAHTHDPMILPDKILRIDSANSKVSEADRLLINTSGTLDYGGYAEKYGYRPVSKMFPIVTLSGKKRAFIARIGTDVDI